MIAGWIASITGSVLLGRAKQVLAGPFGGAIVVTIVALVAVLGTSVVFHVATGRAASSARAACVSEAQADRLARENAAMKDAVQQSQITLQQRGKALEGIEVRVAQTEKERDDARKRAQELAGQCAVVFGADDPWLHPKQPAAKLRPGVR